MITFDELRIAVNEREDKWPGVEKIDMAFHGLELAGEAGELCNVLKKMVRIERGIAGTTEPPLQLLIKVSDELGDVVICCALIANLLGMDLGSCVREKFNRTSEKHGFDTRIT